VCGNNSVFFLSKSVKEEEEGWAIIFLFLLVGVCEASIHVVVFSGKDLNFIELLEDVLDEESCALLEGRDSLLLSEFGHLGLQSLQVLYSKGYQYQSSPI
jgi:hypothetical protein